MLSVSYLVEFITTYENNFGADIINKIHSTALQKIRTAGVDTQLCQPFVLAVYSQLFSNPCTATNATVQMLQTSHTRSKLVVATVARD